MVNVMVWAGVWFDNMVGYLWNIISCTGSSYARYGYTRKRTVKAEILGKKIIPTISSIFPPLSEDLKS